MKQQIMISSERASRRDQDQLPSTNKKCPTPTVEVGFRRLARKPNTATMTKAEVANRIPRHELALTKECKRQTNVRALIKYF